MLAALKIEERNHLHDPKPEDHNCTTCHEHHHEEEKTDTTSLVKKIHQNNGHECIDPHCDIGAPHAHNQVEKKDNHRQEDKAIGVKHEHKAIGVKHDHKHEHKHDHHHDHKFPVFPLEDFVSHAKLPKWFRETLLNASFLSPAMITTELLEKAPIPKVLKTWLAITAMHATTRGKQKLPRLGLTYLISGAASLGSKSPLGAKLSRFFATSAVAFVEKFSSNGHHHAPETMEKRLKREIGTLVKNISNKKQWNELFPSLINIETKVQIIAPFVNSLIEKTTKDLNENTKKVLNVIAKVIGTSLSFVGTDTVLTHFAKKYIGEDSAFAASLSSVCGCCGSPVCSAAATDTALSNSM